jgi:hypothetical protein
VRERERVSELIKWRKEKHNSIQEIGGEVKDKLRERVRERGRDRKKYLERKKEIQRGSGGI